MAGALDRRDIDRDHGDPVRALLSTELISAGEFRCSPLHPDFRTAGQMRRHCFVFARRAVRIEHTSTAFNGDPSQAALYNPARPYERFAIDPDGDHSDWITLAPHVAREVVESVDPTAADRDDRHLLPWTNTPIDDATYLRHRVLHRYLSTKPDPDILAVEETALHLFWTVCRRAVSQ